MTATPTVDYDLLLKLAEQAVRTRALQHKYFKDRTQTNLINATKAEGVLDILLQRFEVAVELAQKMSRRSAEQPPLLPPR
jgi:hypothetical protein